MNKTKDYLDCGKRVLAGIAAKKYPRFEINHHPYYINSNERCVEIPWALSQYQGQARILDVGVALADQALMTNILALTKYGVNELHGLDIVNFDRVKNRFSTIDVQLLNKIIFWEGDVRKTGYPDNFFGLIFLISTIEHIGFDSVNYNTDHDTVFNRPLEKLDIKAMEIVNNEDSKTIAELGRILAPGGKLIITAPYGQDGLITLKDSKDRWSISRNYGKERWQKLIQITKMKVEEERYFYNNGNQGWLETKDQNILAKIRYDEDKEIAGAVTCLVLIKYAGSNERDAG